MPIFFTVPFEYRISLERERALRDGFTEKQMGTHIVNSFEDICEAHLLEIKRREGLQQRAQGNLIAASITVSFVFGAIGVLLDKNVLVDMEPKYFYSVIFSTIIGSVSLVLCAICVIHAIRVLPLFDRYLQVRRPRNTGAEIASAKTMLIQNILLNQAGTLVAANYASASYVYLRNGVICIGVVLVILLSSLGRGSSSKSLTVETRAAEISSYYRSAQLNGRFERLKNRIDRFGKKSFFSLPSGYDLRSWPTVIHRNSVEIKSSTIGELSPSPVKH
jgi:hypothetical protein